MDFAGHSEATASSPRTVLAGLRSHSHHLPSCLQTCAAMHPLTPAGGLQRWRVLIAEQHLRNLLELLAHRPLMAA